MYFQVLVSYDIENNKNRTKLFKELKDLGLKPVQKSVFWGYVLKSEKRVIKELFETYCEEGDKAFVLNVKLDKNLEDSFGYKNEDFSHPEMFEII